MGIVGHDAWVDVTMRAMALATATARCSRLELSWAGRAGGDALTKVAESLESLDCGRDAPGRRDPERIEATACTGSCPARRPAGPVAGAWWARTGASEVLGSPRTLRGA